MGEDKMKNIKFCCDEREENSCAFEIYEDIFNIADPTIRISTCEEFYYRLEYVKYCPFCGKKLRII